MCNMATEEPIGKYKLVPRNQESFSFLFQLRGSQVKNTHISDSQAKMGLLFQLCACYGGVLREIVK